MKSFPEKIKEARSALSMSQETLAEKVGASRRSIIAYEKGDKHPRDRMLYQLAKALHVSIRYLKDDTCENPREDIERIFTSWRHKMNMVPEMHGMLRHFWQKTRRCLPAASCLRRKKTCSLRR